MLIRFVVSNFLSFNEETEFSMIAGPYKTQKHHITPVGDINLLKTTAIYGTNGAGKSNFVKAIRYFIDIIINGGLNESVYSKRYKLVNLTEAKPTTFEIEFSIDKKTYAYGIVISNFSIIEEWLYETSSRKNGKMVFERKMSKSKSQISLAEKYLKTDKQKMLVDILSESILKQADLLLGKHNELKISEISTVYEYLSENIVTIFPMSTVSDLIPKLNTIHELKEFSNKIINTFDTGVFELDIETIDFDKYFGESAKDLKEEVLELIESGNPEVTVGNGDVQVSIALENQKLIVKKIVAKHKLEDTEINLDLEEESDGTRRLLDFIPAFFMMSLTDSTYIIDEIDQSLHPALLKVLIKKVLDNSKLKGQLIFTTHESNLLDFDIFRPDEIWFTEKDKTAQTRMYSLSDFKPRYDLDIRKGYLKGRFGAIPFLANLEELKW